MGFVSCRRVVCCEVGRDVIIASVCRKAVVNVERLVAYCRIEKENLIKA